MGGGAVTSETTRPGEAEPGGVDGRRWLQGWLPRAVGQSVSHIGARNGARPWNRRVGFAEVGRWAGEDQH